MIIRAWSYRKGLTKVVAVLATLAVLTSVGMVAPAPVFAEVDVCAVMPEVCVPPIIVEPIDHGTGDNSGWLHDNELREQFVKDMPSNTSGTPGHPAVAVDRKRVHFDHDVLPWVNPETNRTLVPIRPIAEAMGFEVTWTPDSPNDVFIERDGTTVHFVIGDNKATVNGKTFYMDQPSILMNDARTMVPLRFLVEAFGSKVDWVGDDGPNDPRVPQDSRDYWIGKYQVWIWSPWGYWGNYDIGDRLEAGNWGLRDK